MKTIFLTLLAAAFCMNLKAQEAPTAVTAPHVVIEPVVVEVDPVMVIDTIVVEIDMDTTEIEIVEEDIEEIEHDHEFDFDWCSDKHRKNRIGKFTGHWEGVELGINGFDKPDYTMYNGNEFMALDQGKSMEVDLNFYQLNIGLYKSYMGLVSGMGLSFNSYRFEEPYTFVRETQRIEPVLLDTENLSKTKLAVSYLQVPLLLEFQVPVNQNEGRLYIQAGVVGGIKIGSHTKVKYGDDKEKDRSGFHLNAFKYAATARIGYKDIGLFGSYSLTPLFESGKGPELTPFTIGISFLN